MKNKMKHLIYIYSLAVAALLMVGCDDDNNWNTSAEVTVSMEQTAMMVKENKGLFNVPITVKGERNGAVEVDVEVKSTDPACVEDVHYLVTSKHIIIPHDKKVGYVEIKSMDDRTINADRTFVIEIVNVRGAKMAETNVATTITLMDNDDIPYDRLGGKWTVTATDMLQEAGPVQVSWTTNLTTVSDESEEGYGSNIIMSPWRMWNGETYEGQLDIMHNLTFHYNASSQTATLDLKLGQVMAEGFALGGENEDGLNLTSCTLRSATPSMNNYTLNGTVVGTVNEDFTQITFNLPLMGLLFEANNRPFSYWFYYTDVVLTRE